MASTDIPSASTGIPEVVDEPVVVTALVDVDRRGARPEQVRERGVIELLELAPRVLEVPLPMVIFTEVELLDRLRALRRDLAPTVPTVVVPFESTPEWEADVAHLRAWLGVRRPLCSSNIAKDTPEFLALGWSKTRCLRAAMDHLCSDWYWWLDIGIAHTSAVPRDLAGRLGALSLRIEKNREPHPRYEPSVHLVSLECEGWHAEYQNVAHLRRFAATDSEDWWFGGAQLVVGGIIGVAAQAIERVCAGIRGAADDAARHGAAVTEEMLLSRWIVQERRTVALHPGGYSDLFANLVAESRPRLDVLCPSTRFFRLPDPERSDRAAFNPSIATDPRGGFRVIVRHSNYEYVAGEYRPLDGTDLIITDNVLIQLDRDFSVLWSESINDEIARCNPPLFPVHGLEDMRLFRYAGRWMASATSREHRSDGLCQMVVVEFDENVPSRISSSFRLPAMRVGRHEKNWAPFVMDASDRSVPMAFLWSTRPPRLVMVDDVLQAMVVDGPPALEIFLPMVRGSSQVIAMANGWLTTVHRAVASPGHSAPVYEHQIIHYDSSLEVSRCSPWFVFARDGVEFCAGMATDDDGIVLSFGFEDREAWLAHVPWVELDRLLDDEVSSGD